VALCEILKDETLIQLEADAREAKRGLWMDTEPMPPWEYRHPTRQSSSEATVSEPLLSHPPITPSDNPAAIMVAATIPFTIGPTVPVPPPRHRRTGKCLGVPKRQKLTGTPHHAIVLGMQMANARQQPGILQSPCNGRSRRPAVIPAGRHAQTATPKGQLQTIRTEEANFF
jgi:hypothetical protein